MVDLAMSTKFHDHAHTFISGLCRDGSGCLYAAIQTKVALLLSRTENQQMKLTMTKRGLNRAHSYTSFTAKVRLHVESALNISHSSSSSFFFFLFVFFSDSHSAQTKGTWRMLLAPYSMLHSFVG